MIASEAKLIDNEYFSFTMPVVEFVELGLCGEIYDVVSPSQRLMSTTNTSHNLHDHAKVGKIDVLTMKIFFIKRTLHSSVRRIYS